GVKFHEAVFGAELDAGRICLLTALVHRPAVKKLCSYIERSNGIPDQVAGGISGMVVGRERLKVGVVNRSIGIHRTGAQSLRPIVLVSRLDPRSRGRLQMVIGTGCWFRVDPQSRSVLNVAGDAVPCHYGKDNIVAAESFHARGEIYAPSKDGACFPVREKGSDVTE